MVALSERKRRDNAPDDLDIYRRKRNKANKTALNKPVNVLNIIIIAAVFITVFSYIAQAAFAYINKPDISTGIVSYGSVDLPQIIDGIIIRSENVYTADASGVLSFYYNDYDRVKKDSVACAIVDEATAAEISAEISKIESKIMNVQDMRSNTSAFSADVEMKNKQIKKIVDSGVPRLINLNISSVYELKDSVSQSVGLRNQMLLSDGTGSVKGMVDAKVALNSRLSEAMSVITVENSGIISYIVDGLEEALNFENKESLTPEQVQMFVDYSKLASYRNVSPGDKIFKVVESNEWYVAAYIPKELVINWSEGEFRKIYVQDSFDSGVFEPIEMSVFKINRLPGGNNDYVLFKCTVDMLDYLNMRSLKLKTVDSEHSGYKIPKQAIVEKMFVKFPSSFVEKVEENNGNFVYKQVNGTTEKVSLDSAEKMFLDGDFAYVLQESNVINVDDILVSPESKELYVVSETENVKGVYKINQGFADFSRIIIDENTPESGGYCILDVSLNTSIKISDKIVTDAKNIHNGQIIY